MLYRLIIMLLGLLLILYYALVVLHLLGVVKMTKQTIRVKKLLIPFYYFINNSKQKKQ